MMREPILINEPRNRNTFQTNGVMEIVFFIRVDKPSPDDIQGNDWLSIFSDLFLLE